MNLLVTGGSGFIGCNFIRYWLNKYPGDRIVNYDLNTYAGWYNWKWMHDTFSKDRYSRFIADISNRGSLDRVISANFPDIIVNFAAESHNSRAILHPDEFLRANTMGVYELLEACRRYDIRLHHVSTCEVYGDLPLGEVAQRDGPWMTTTDLKAFQDMVFPFAEDSPLRPNTPYSATKACAELLIRAWQNTFGIRATVSNCCNNYGPYQLPEKVIPKFITSYLNEKKLTVYRHSENMREWIYVDDHIRGIEYVIHMGDIGETYNIGTGEEFSVRQIANFVLQALGHGADHCEDFIEIVEDRPGHDRRYLLDCHKMYERGWSSIVSFERGLRHTVQWYMEHKDWWGSYVDEIDETAWIKKEGE